MEVGIGAFAVDWKLTPIISKPRCRNTIPRTIVSTQVTNTFVLSRICQPYRPWVKWPVTNPYVLVLLIALTSTAA